MKKWATLLGLIVLLVVPATASAGSSRLERRVAHQARVIRRLQRTVRNLVRVERCLATTTLVQPDSATSDALTLAQFGETSAPGPRFTVVTVGVPCGGAYWKNGPNDETVDQVWLSSFLRHRHR